MFGSQGISGRGTTWEHFILRSAEVVIICFSPLTWTAKSKSPITKDRFITIILTMFIFILARMECEEYQNCIALVFFGSWDPISSLPLFSLSIFYSYFALIDQLLSWRHWVTGIWENYERCPCSGPISRGQWGDVWTGFCWWDEYVTADGGHSVCWVATLTDETQLTTLGTDTSHWPLSPQSPLTTAHGQPPHILRDLEFRWT